MRSKIGGRNTDTISIGGGYVKMDGGWGLFPLYGIIELWGRTHARKRKRWRTWWEALAPEQ